MAVKLHWEDRQTGKVHHECVVEGFTELENGKRRFYRRRCKHNDEKKTTCLSCVIMSGNIGLKNLFESE